MLDARTASRFELRIEWIALALASVSVACGDAEPSVRQLADLATVRAPEDPSKTIASFPSFLVSLGAERAAFVAFPLTANDPPPAPATAPGTLYVTDGRTLSAVHTFEDYPHNLRAIGETLFFTAGDATSWGIWKSDGASVELVQAIPKGAAAAPGERNRAFDAVVGDHYCVSVWSSGVGAPGGVWATDGSPGGTLELSSDLRGNLAAHGTELVVMPWQLGVMPQGALEFFDLSTGDHRSIPLSSPTGPTPVDAAGALFLTTGSADGHTTTLSRADGAGLTDLHTFEADRHASFAQAIGGRYFLGTALSDGTSYELWTSDGTPDGTVRVFAAEHLSPGVAWEGGAMFGAADGLWKIEGGARTASRVAKATDAADLLAIDGRLLFSASDLVHGRELWSSDGTPEGTRILADVALGSPSSDPAALTRAGARAVFVADDGRTGAEPWAFDPGE